MHVETAISPQFCRAPDFDERLRHDFGAVTARSRAAAPAGVTPHRHITMAGALYQKDGQLSASDRFQLSELFKACATYGIPVAADFSVAVRNLAYGDNVLDQPRPDGQKTDIFVSAFILGARANPEHLKKSPEDQILFLRAANHDHQNIWAQAAEQSGADMVVAFAKRQYELRPAHFARAPFMRADNLLASDYFEAAGILLRDTYAHTLQHAHRRTGRASALSVELDRILPP